MWELVSEVCRLLLVKLKRVSIWCFSFVYKVRARPPVATYRKSVQKTQQWPQDWKRSVFIPITKKGNAKECSNYCTIALISHASNREGNGTPLQYSHLENPMDGGAW